MPFDSLLVFALKLIIFLAFVTLVVGVAIGVSQKLDD